MKGSFITTLFLNNMKLETPKNPGKTESRLSMAIMAIIVIIGAGVILRQDQINPAVVALRPESHRLGPAQAPDQPPLIDTADSGIAPFSPPERFGPENLYEKINGRADLYLSAGFISLNTQRFAWDANAGSWVEVFIYDMGTPANAFSVFSMQRREGAQSDDAIANAYRTENALFMSHEQFYVEVIGTEASADVQQAMTLLAQGFVNTHGGATEARVPGADLFPADGRLPHRLQLIAADAFGYEMLDRIYTCEYDLDGTVMTAFVSARESPDAASVLAAEYQQTLMTYGAAAIETPLSIDDGVVLQFFDTYEIVFSRGRYLVGIHEAEKLEAASSLAKQLSDHLTHMDEN